MELNFDDLKKNKYDLKVMKPSETIRDEILANKLIPLTRLKKLTSNNPTEV